MNIIFKQPLIVGIVVSSIMFWTGMALANDAPSPVCRVVSHAYFDQEMKKLVSLSTQIKDIQDRRSYNSDNLREDIELQTKLLDDMRVIVNEIYKRALCHKSFVDWGERHN